MSLTQQDFLRILQEAGAIEAVANTERMRVDQTVRQAFFEDGRLRPEMVSPQFDGEWNGRHLRIGPAHIWFDYANRSIRAKYGAPTSATDGTVVVTI